MTDVIVRPQHLHDLEYCSRGVRAYCKHHNIDYPKFIDAGIKAEELLKATGNDHMAICAVEAARAKT